MVVDGLSVRAASPDDLDAVRGLLGSTARAAHVTEVESALGDAHRVVLVAERGGDGVVGVGLMRLADAAPGPAGGARARAEVLLLAVHPSLRGRGVGAALLEAMGREAAARGAAELRVTTRARRPAP